MNRLLQFNCSYANGAKEANSANDANRYKPYWAPAWTPILANTDASIFGYIRGISRSELEQLLVKRKECETQFFEKQFTKRYLTKLLEEHCLLHSLGMMSFNLRIIELLT